MLFLHKHHLLIMSFFDGRILFLNFLEQWNSPFHNVLYQHN
jgi:hypothetical protein